MTALDPKQHKLFPRNLTARADTIVRGNPVTSRPEDGVENCFPGLEFDHRNLDKVFFPGLVVELHHDLGVILREVDPQAPPATLVSAQDVESGMFLVFIEGNFASRQRGVEPAPDIFEFRSPAGLGAWRIIHDLEPGLVAVALCDRATYVRLMSVPLDTERSVTRTTFAGWLEEGRTNRIITVPDFGKFVLLFSERAQFLTEDGVIDPARVQPGDLTRSLCSPWQYDFADCGCFYWASNKPDLVSSPAQKDRVLNFQRRDRSETRDSAATGQSWILEQNYRWDSRQFTLNHAEMIQRWSSLPFVLDGREGTEYVPRRAGRPSRPLNRATIIDRLKRLAPVEHALAIEYLYAYYSLAQPRNRTTSSQPDEQRIFTAAAEIFKIAIDEMRHLRLVNEVLIDLGAGWVLDRAAIIGEDFDGDGNAFNEPYKLLPLTGEQLRWFIRVEEASQSENQNTIDGMYTLILRSIEVGTEFSPEEKARLSHLVKIIIDEGMDHFRGFLRAQAALEGLPEDRYLSVKGAPVQSRVGRPERILQDAVDAAYVVVLRSLDYVFRLADQQRGAMLEAARRGMYNMDDAARLLAARGVGGMFDMSRYRPAITDVTVSGPSPTVDGPARLTAVARLVGGPLADQLPTLRGSGDRDLAALADRMAARLETMTRAFEDGARDN